MLLRELVAGSGIDGDAQQAEVLAKRCMGRLPGGRLSSGARVEISFLDCSGGQSLIGRKFFTGAKVCQ